MSKKADIRVSHSDLVSARSRVAILAIVVVFCSSFKTGTSAHGFGSQITWNREVSRIIYARCASCHRPGATAFSLMTYAEAQPRANAIKDAVLSRRMPPWGAIKGFGHFRNDESLTQEQIELITKWVDGGIRRGNNPRMLPKNPVFDIAPQPRLPSTVVSVQGTFRLRQSIILDGLQPQQVPSGRSMRLIAVLPGGSIEPLVWLHEYDSRFPHPFLFRRAMHLPAGTLIQGVPIDAIVALLPANK